MNRLQLRQRAVSEVFLNKSRGQIYRSKARPQLRLSVKAQQVQEKGGLSDTESDYKRRIIVAVDDSEDSELACRWAVNQMYMEGDKFHIMHVVPKISQRPVYHWPDKSFLQIPLTDELSRQMEEMQESKISSRFSSICEKTGVPYELDIIVEEPELTRKIPIGEVICNAARKIDAAAVVMGSHGKAALSEWFIGSVSNYVKHHATKPVMLLHNTHLEKCDASEEPCNVDRSIVVAVNDSPLAERALLFAINNLYRQGDVFHLLHVIPQVPIENAYLIGIDGVIFNMTPTDRKLDEDNGEIKEYISRRFVGHLDAKNIPYEIDIIPERAWTSKEVVGEVICKKSADLEARMIVMGAPTKKSPMADFFMGSISSYCSHHSQVPVAVLH
eukprot:TRINITY_DN877_c0_g1_i1.p1 TRINITY_DN877_c0_g1~~TRINITY_DN877_c0_g1_i1.p1  ORF type:complete len:386 (-),score=40.68 TRINITY_DN877_c0_g1_i1:340-1497(-)